MLGTHAGQLDRWLGRENAEHVSRLVQDWYGPPIGIAGVPGAVYACKGGDIRGPIGAGKFSSAYDVMEARLKRLARNFARRQRAVAGAGFSSLSDLIAEATTGKLRQYDFQKAGATGVVGVTNSLWGLGPSPAAGANGSAAPSGRAPTDATTGAFLIDNVSTDTRHITGGYATASVAGNTLLLYDRIFDVAKTMNSTATESVTGVPTRYQNSTATAMDYAGGNFCFVEVGSVALAAVAHNWTVCQYRNQAGTDAQSFPSMTGNSSAIVRRLDHPAMQWFMPLNAGDVGVMDLAQMQCSALVTSGEINFVIGHPLAFFPCPVANMACQLDGINTAFSLARIFDDAALSWLELNKPATTATNYTMTVQAVHG